MHLSRINIAVLCNNEIAVPAMRELAVHGVLRTVIVPEENKNLFVLLSSFFTGSEVEIISVNKKSLPSVFNSLIKTKNITTAWLMTFPYILPASMLSSIPFINFHYGILPKYRGVNPVLAQMLHYETHSGITIHLVNEKIDAGPIILQHKIPIEDTDTFAMQMNKLGQLGAYLAMQFLKVMQISENIPCSPQDESSARYFKPVTADDLMIKWNTMSSRQIVRLINACNPWNKGAGTTINGNVICFTQAEVNGSAENLNVQPGTITGIGDERDMEIVCCDNKLLRVNIVYTPEGFFRSNRLLAYNIKTNDRFI